MKQEYRCPICNSNLIDRHMYDNKSNILNKIYCCENYNCPEFTKKGNPPYEIVLNINDKILGEFIRVTLIGESEEDKKSYRLLNYYSRNKLIIFIESKRKYERATNDSQYEIIETEILKFNSSMINCNNYEGAKKSLDRILKLKSFA